MALTILSNATVALRMGYFYFVACRPLLSQHLAILGLWLEHCKSALHPTEWFSPCDLLWNVLPPRPPGQKKHIMSAAAVDDTTPLPSVVWQSFLGCFRLEQAMDIDLMFGGTASPHLVGDRMTTIPSAVMWPDVVQGNRVGMANYLLEYGVRPLAPEAVLQQSVDCGSLGVVLCLAKHIPVNLLGCPSLDRAVRTKRLDVAQYVLQVFGHLGKEKMASHETLQNTMRPETMPFCKELCQDRQIPFGKGLLRAARKKDYKDVFDWVLPRTQASVNELASLAVACIRLSRVERLKAVLATCATVKAHPSVVDAAFVSPHNDIRPMILPDNFSPTEVLMCRALRAGVHPGRYLPARPGDIPQTWVDAAVRGGNIKAFDACFGDHHVLGAEQLELAIQSGNVHMVPHVFDRSEMVSISEETIGRVLDTRNAKLLLYLDMVLEQDVLSPATLVEACRRGNVAAVRLVLEHRAFPVSLVQRAVQASALYNGSRRHREVQKALEAAALQTTKAR
jgi:hypothetical protein